MSFYALFAADLLNTFSWALGVWDDYVCYVGLSLGGVLSVVLPLVLSALSSVVPSLVLPSSWLLFIKLLWTLSIAHLGYLHLARASVRCGNSLLKTLVQYKLFLPSG